MFMKTKDRCGNQPPLTPPSPRRGTPSSPPRMRRGGGGAALRTLRALRLGVKPAFGYRKMGEQSQNVYENKEQDRKSGNAKCRFCGLRLFRDPWQRAADRKTGAPRYIKIERTIRECLRKQTTMTISHRHAKLLTRTICPSRRRPRPTSDLARSILAHCPHITLRRLPSRRGAAFCDRGGEEVQTPEGDFRVIAIAGIPGRLADAGPVVTPPCPAQEGVASASGAATALAAWAETAPTGSPPWCSASGQSPRSI